MGGKAARGRSVTGPSRWLLRERDPRKVLAAALLMVVLAGLIQRTMGIETSLWAVYLIPVSAIAWHREPVVALVVATFAAFVSMTAMDTGFDVAPFLTLASDLAVAAGLVFVLSVLKRALEREREMWRTDQLSGGCSSSYFRAIGEREFARASREGSSLAFAYIDLDDFKTVNDTLGHDVGDEVLRVTGDALMRAFRETDVVGRLGGDEFAVLLPDIDRVEAERVIERGRCLVTRSLEGLAPSVTLSIGLAVFDHAWPTFEEAVRIADAAMYAVKRGGKDGVRVTSGLV